jgi:hypothetical protein
LSQDQGLTPPAGGNKSAFPYGLETCPQFALAMYPDIVAQHIDVPQNHDLVCGMSIGYGDPDAPVNQYRTERMAVGEFLTWAE